MTNGLTVNEMNGAREDILGSIRRHLAGSASIVEISSAMLPTEIETSSVANPAFQRNGDERPLLERFRTLLESVGAHFTLIRNEAELMLAVKRIFAELQSAAMQTRRVALSDAALPRSLADYLAELSEVSVVPSTNDLFGFDVGITTAQAAIAETGTLILDSECERHRLVSLLPPVHIAIVDSKAICATLGDAIKTMRKKSELSRAITLITGPSRTADIELTLTIGVHGPKELYVIVNEGAPLKAANI